MCWNFEVSAGTFALVLGVGWSLWTRNLPFDRLLAFFLVSYGSMQAFEALMWLGQRPGQQQLNYAGSLGAAALLYSHPLAMGLGALSDRAFRGIGGNGAFQAYLATAVGFLAWGVWQIWKGWESGAWSFASHPDPKSGHMVWEFPTHYYSVMVLILIFSILFLLPRSSRLFGFLAAYFLLPAAYTMWAIPVDERNAEKNYNGSYWCWWVAIAAGLFYMRPF